LRLGGGTHIRVLTARATRKRRSGARAVLTVSLMP
jgi:hypothetical protein